MRYVMEQSEEQHSEGVQQGVCGLSLNTAARFLWSMVKLSPNLVTCKRNLSSVIKCQMTKFVTCTGSAGRKKNMDGSPELGPLVLSGISQPLTRLLYVSSETYASY